MTSGAVTAPLVVEIPNLCGRGVSAAAHGLDRCQPQLSILVGKHQAAPPVTLDQLLRDHRCSTIPYRLLRVLPSRSGPLVRLLLHDLSLGCRPPAGYRFEAKRHAEDQNQDVGNCTVDITDISGPTS